jgi:putative transposase
MSRTKFIYQIYPDLKEVDINMWKKVLTTNMTEEEKNTYENRKKAVILYIENELTLKEISSLTGIYTKRITDLVKKCLSKDADNNILGFSALIPFKRIKSDKYRGQFKKLLFKYPALEDYIFNTYFNTRKKIGKEYNIKFTTLFNKYLQFCKEIDIKADEYPFNTSTYGKSSLYRYIKNLEKENINKTSRKYNQESSRKKYKTSEKPSSSSYIKVPFQRVEFDAHRIDAIFTINLKTIDGDIVTKNLNRLWLLAIIDVATKAIIGHYISLNIEYNSEDVLRCIKNAIVPRVRKDFKITNFNYPENGGYPSLFLNDTEWAVWEEFCYDNAKANIAKHVRDVLISSINCSINMGPVKTPERRGTIERFFRVLEDKAYHRLPSTTGSNPKDPLRYKPGKYSKEFNVSLEDLHEITELSIAQYNNTPKHTLNGLSPLEVMEQRIKSGMLPRTIEPDKKDNIIFLKTFAKRKVKGNVKNGQKSYINFLGVRYRSPILSKSSYLINETVILEINNEDLRTINLYLQDGSEFCTVTAEGKWGIQPHSLLIRKEINKLKNRKIINIGFGDDPISIYNNYLKMKMITSKIHVNKKAILDEIINNAKIKNEKEYVQDNFDEVDETKEKPITKRINKTIIY